MPNAEKTEEIKIEIILHQGSALSPSLFIINLGVITYDNVKQIGHPAPCYSQVTW